MKASEFLGTPAAMATVREVIDVGYIVHIDGDAPEWYGAVAFDGTVMIESPSGYVRAE